MKVIVEFESWVELEEFRTSGKKTRGKKEEAADEAVEVVAANTPLPPQPSFTPPVQPVAGFPGANGAAPPAVNPLAVAIAAKADNAIAGGQSAEQVLNWFRGQIGPDAASATWEQIKSVYLPRLPEAQLKTIAPQLGITG